MKPLRWPLPYQEYFECSYGPDFNSVRPTMQAVTE